MKKNYNFVGHFLKTAKSLFFVAFLLLTFAFSNQAFGQVVTGSSVCEGSTLVVGIAPTKYANNTFALYFMSGSTYTKVGEIYTSVSGTFDPQIAIGKYEVWSFPGFPPAPADPTTTGTYMDFREIWANPVPGLSGETAPCFNTTEQYTTETSMSAYDWTISNGTITSGGDGNDFVNVLWNVASGSGSVSVNYVNSNGCTAVSPTVQNVFVNTLPSTPTNNDVLACYDGNIYTGSANVGTGETVVWYTTETGSTTTSSPSLSSVGSTSAWAVAQNTTTLCESSSRVEVTVTIYDLPLPTIISGETNPCVSTEYTYTSQSGKSNYSWSVSANGTITEGGASSDDYVNVTWGNNPGAGSVFVNYENSDGCEAASATQYDVSTNGLVYNSDQGIYYCTLQDAITAANPDETIQINGELVLSNNITLTKKLTIDGLNVGSIKGDNTLPSVGGGRYFMLISGSGAGSTVQNLDFVKTDKTGVQNIIGLQANDVTFDNCDFNGQYVLGEGDVSRGFETAYNTMGILIQNCSFIALRQPGYFNPGSKGQVLNNYIEGTRGWTVFGQPTPLTEIVFSGNSWLNNAVDIYLDGSVHFGAPYDPIATLSANNNNANIQDSRSSYKVVNYTKDKAYTTIQAAINDADLLNPTGDEIYISAGTYTENISTAFAGPHANLFGENDLSGNPLATIKGSLLLDNFDGMSISDLRFEVNTTDLLTLQNINGLTITNCLFDGNIITGNNGEFLAGKTGINFLSTPGGNIDVTVDGCVFTNGLYVGISSRITNLTVQNSTFNNIKSGINHKNSNNLVVSNCAFSVEAQGTGSDTYGIRFGENTGGPVEGIIVLDCSFNVDNNGFGTDPGTFHSPIIIRANAAGSLTAHNSEILGDVVNESTTAFDATCNWWGTDNAYSIGNAVSGDVNYLPYLVQDAGGITYPWSGTNTYSCSGNDRVVNITQGKSYMTIRSAISDVTTVSGDIITVGDGTYDYISEGISAGSQGLINVNKGVTLEAAAGVRPIIDGTGVDGVFKIHPAALDDGNTVRIEGFEITGDPTTGIAMTMQGCFNNNPAEVIIHDNEFHGMIGAINFWGAVSYLPSGWTSGVVNTKISNNKFYDLVAAGPYPGFGVLIESPVDWTTAGNDYAVKIENNEFSNIETNGTELGTGIGILDHNGALINANAYISGNKFTSDVAIGAAFSNGDVTHTQVIGNSFENSIYGIYATAITNSPIDAKCNWWGTDNAYTIGNAISGDVQFLPYLEPDAGGITYPWSGIATYACNGNNRVLNITKGKSYNTIQSAIDDVTTTHGDVITVGAGTYNYISEGSPVPSGLIKVTKGITLKAADGVRPIIDGTDFDGVFKIHPSALLPGNTVIIEGFDIVGNEATSIAMTMQGCFDVTPANVIITDNWFHGMVGGIDFWGAGGYLPTGWTSALANIEITENKFYDMVTSGTDQGFGVMIEDPANWVASLNNYAVKIENNEFSNLPSNGTNYGFGIVIPRANDTWEAANVHISGNSFASNVPIGVAFLDGDVTTAQVVNNSFINNTVYAILATGIDNPPIDATCNWFGTIEYTDIFAKIQGSVVYTPYLLDDPDVSPVCAGGPAIPANLTLTYNAASQNIIVAFDVTDNELELQPVPGLNPSDPNYQTDVYNLYLALQAALVGGDPTTIQAAALAIGDDIITEYYYMDGATKVYLETAGSNPLIKSKYWDNYLVRVGDNVTFPNWVPGDLRTLVTIDGYRTHTNPATLAVSSGWLNPVLGKDLHINVTILNNGYVNTLHQTVAIDAGPVNVYSAEPIGPATWVSSHIAIQDGIDASVDGNIITVDAGTYAEDIVVDKEVDLRGPNYNVSPNADPNIRVAEAIIVPADIWNADPNNNSGKREWNWWSIVTFEVDGIKMNGFKISGDNPLLDGYDYAGMDVEAGIGVYSEGNNIEFKYNYVENFTVMGFWAGGTQSTQYKYLDVSNNKVDKIHDLNLSGYGFGMYIQGTAGSITNNVVTNVRAGIQIQPYQVLEGTSPSIVQNNSFFSYVSGLYYNYAEVNASAWTIQTNNIGISAPPVTPPDGPLGWTGMKAETMRNTGNGGTLIGNTIDGTGATVDNINWTKVWGMHYKGGSSNSIEVYFTNNIVSNVEFGFVHDAPADIVFTGNSLNASQKAISVQGANNIDATGGNTFNGVASATATLAELFAIEDAIDHKIDDANLGIVKVKDLNTYVTVNSFISPATTTPSINRGINAAGATGWTVNVNDGTFTENVAVNKSVTVLGQGPTPSTIVQPTATANIAFTVSADNVTIKDLKITEPTGLVNGIQVVSPASSGLWVENVHFTNMATATGANAYGINLTNSFSNLDVIHCKFISPVLLTNTRGIGVFAPNHLTLNDLDVTGSTFENLFVGVYLRSAIDDLYVFDNTFGPFEINDCTAAVAGIYIGDGDDNNFDIENVSVIENDFIDYGRGVYVWNYGANSIIDNFEISGNTFTNSIWSSGIRFILGLDGFEDYSFDGINIDDNQFTQDSDIGGNVALVDFRTYDANLLSCDVSVTNNTMNFSDGPYANAMYGVQFFVAGDGFYNTTVSGNDINGGSIGGAGTPVSSGINIAHYSGDYTWTNDLNLDILNNKIYGFDHGVSIYDKVNSQYGGLPSGTDVNINENNLAGNALYGIAYGIGETVDATCNWWGNPLTNAIIGTVDFIPYLDSDGNSAPLNPGFIPTGNCITPVAFYVNDVSTTNDHYTSAIGNDANLGTADAPFATLEHAIEIAQSGNTIYVDAGIYSGNVTIDRSIILIGDPGNTDPGCGTGVAIIDGGSAPGDAFLIANGVTNVTIRGFEMRNFTSPLMNGIGNGVSAWVGSTSNITIEDNYFHNLGYNGVLVGNDYNSDPNKWGDHNYWTIKNNIIEDFGYIGFELTNTSTSSIESNVIHMMTPYIGAIFSSARRSETGLTIKNNMIDGTPSATYPVIYIYAYDLDMPSPNLNSVVIEGNSIATTAIPSQIYIRDINTGTVTGVTLVNNSLSTFKTNTPAVINAVNNYWGSANGPVHAKNVYNMGSQGGTITVSTGGSVPVFCPWWEDISGAPGSYTGTSFAPITNDESEGYSNFADAIAGTLDDGTINAVAGTYTDAMTVTKPLILNGAKAGVDARTRNTSTGESILDGTGLSSTQYDAIKIADGVTNVTIDGFEIRNYAGSGSNGDGNGISSYCMSSNTTGSSNITVQNNYIHDVDYNGILVGSENIIGESMVVQSGWLIQKNKLAGFQYAGIELTNVISSQVMDNDIAAPVDLFPDAGDAGVAIEIAARSRVKPVIAGTNILVSGNTITGAFPTGSRAVINILSRTYLSTSNATLSGITLDDNDISGATNVRAAVLTVAESRNDGSATIGNLAITNNILDGNLNAIGFQDYINGGSGPASHSGITVTGNEIKNSTGIGLHILPATSASGILVYENLIVSNTDFGAKNEGLESLSATCNWWGTTDASQVNAINTGDVEFLPFWTTVTGPCDGFGPVIVYEGISPIVRSSHMTIQDGIYGAVPGDVITVANGNYYENIVVDKSLTITGESKLGTIIIPAFSGPNPGGGGSIPAGSSNVILVQANNVTIQNLTVDGDNPDLTSGIVSNGTDIDARNGIITNHSVGTFNNLKVDQVLVKNIYLRGIYASSGGSFIISNNTVTNVNGEAASIAMMNWAGSGYFTGNTVSNSNDGIVSNHSIGTIYSGNNVSSSGTGIHTDNNTTTADQIFNNNVSNCGYGIFVFAPSVNVSVSGNTITNSDVGLCSAGSYSAVPLSVNFANNIIDGQNKANSVGIYSTTEIWGYASGNQDASFINNYIQNTANAFLLASELGYTNSTTVFENSITGNTLGVKLVNDYTEIPPTGDFDLSMTCNWWGTDDYSSITDMIGGVADFQPYLVVAGEEPGQETTIGFQPLQPTPCANGVVAITSATPEFEHCGVLGSIEIIWTAGTGPFDVSWTGTETGSAINETSPYTIPDLSAGPYEITVQAVGSQATTNATVDYFPVTNTSSLPDPTYFATIGEAIAAAGSGDVIEVCDGNYTENLIISQDITINGPNIGKDPNVDVRLDEAVLLDGTLQVSGSATVVIDGIKVHQTNNTSDAVLLGGPSTVTIQNSIIERFGVDTGIGARGITTSAGAGVKNILNNLFTGDASGGVFGGHKTWNSGMYVNGGGSTLNIIDNVFENCRTAINLDDFNANIALSGNTFQNSGTCLAFGGTTPTDGSYTLGSNNFIPVDAIINLSNVAETFRLDITSSMLDGAIFNTLDLPTLFLVEVGMYHRDLGSKKGLVTYVANNLYVSQYFPNIQSAIKYATAGNIINLENFVYTNQRLVIDKSLTLDGQSETGCSIDGTGLGNGHGIHINTGVTNVTIQDLTVRNFAGADGNADAGIYANGGNNYLTVQRVTIKDNRGTTSGSGFYANGPIDNLMLDDVESSGHYPGARGIVIWNGYKSNITIKNCEVFNNNCCGIELQDGTASGVTMTGNNVHDNGDNGMSAVGLTSGAGPNTISGNTLANNGRYGIEVKCPDGTGLTAGDGSIVLDNNHVTFSATPTMNNRDHAGIAIFRRGYLVGQGYNDIPTGVVLTNNTVSGYVQLNTSATESEGFGIVVEGVDHTVSGNNLDGNDVGLQLQGGGHPFANYTPELNTDGDQADGKSPFYFGRGNAPYMCNVTVGPNTFSSTTANGIDERMVIVPNVAVIAPSVVIDNQVSKAIENQTTFITYCSFDVAIAAATPTDELLASTSTFNENVLLNKSVTVQGQGPANTIITPSVSCIGIGVVMSANDAILKDLTVTDFLTGIAVSATGNEINNVESVSNCNQGLELSNGATTLSVLNSKFNNNTSVGVRKGTAAVVSGFTMDNCEVKGNNQGFFIAKNNGVGGTFDNVSITNSDLSNNLIKGMYLEALSNAVFDGITMNLSGTDPNYGNNNGININLKYGSYSNITIKNSTITNCGVKGTATLAEHPSAIAICARDDGGYASNPATLNNVWVLNNYVTGPENGIRFGESGKVNASPTNVTVSENELSYGFANKTLINRTSATVTATCNWFGSIYPATIAGLLDGDVNVESFLTDGTDTSPDIGFQPDLDACDGELPVYNATQNQYYGTIQSAVINANPTGGNNIQVAAGTYVEAGQIVIDKDLSITGAGMGISGTTVKTNQSTGNSGDARGWWLVNDGVTFDLYTLTLDGDGFDIYQGIRHKGTGEIDEVEFTNMIYPTYYGVAVAAFGSGSSPVDISNCIFSQIGRVGVLYFGGGVAGSDFVGNAYTGKGLGDWLDYGVEVGGGANGVIITDFTVSNNLGEALSDNSTSAGMLITEYYGNPSAATVSYSTFTGNTAGIAVGYDEFDGSTLIAHNNKFSGNEWGITSTAPIVDATNNYWGDVAGPYHVSHNTCTTGDAVSDNVDFFEWWANEGDYVTRYDYPVPVITNDPVDVVINQHAERGPYAQGMATATGCYGPIEVSIVDDRSALNQCNATGVIIREFTFTDYFGQEAVCTQQLTIQDNTIPITVPPADISQNTDAGECFATVQYEASATDFGFFQGFEAAGWESVTGSGWYNYNSQITKEASFGSIAPKTGSSFGLINSVGLARPSVIPNSNETGVFSRLGGYNDIANSFSAGFVTSIDVYIDLADPLIANGDGEYGWDLSSAVSNAVAGYHLQDFVFHATAYQNGSVLIDVDNNGRQASGPSNPTWVQTLDHAEISASGWFTFEMKFQDNGSGFLEAVCDIYNAYGTSIWTYVRNSPHEIASIVGGNLYMWFTFVTPDYLAIDNTSLTRNPFVTTDPVSPSQFNVGTTTVDVNAIDACGNVAATGTFNVTIEDSELPNVICQTATVELDANGEGGLLATQVDNGSNDPCGILSLSVAPNTFTCSDLAGSGLVNVTLTATDNNNNENTCSVDVTVVDLIAPTISCPGDQIVCATETATDTYAVLGTEFDYTGSADNCSVASYAWSLTGVTTNSGTTSSLASVVFNEGVTTVSWTAFDVSGNSSVPCTFDVTVNPLPNPVISGNATVVGGSTEVYQTAYVAGHTYDWIVTGATTVVVNPSPNDYICEVVWGASGTGTVAVTETITATGCAYSTAYYSVNITPVALQGTITYKNTSNTPMNNVTVRLRDGAMAIVATTTTDASGHYNFTTVSNGDYTLEVETAKSWGGGNSTDALAIQRTALNWSFPWWTPAPFVNSVGDVNASGNLSSLDALKVKQRTVYLINSFNAGDWAFWALDAAVNFINFNSNTARYAYTHNGATTLDIKAMCYGDVNASFLPGSSKSLLAVQSENVLDVIENNVFQLPVQLLSENEIGAMSIFLNYPDNILEVTSLKSDIPGLIYQIGDGWINVAWSDLTPLNIPYGGTLFTMECSAAEEVNNFGSLFMQSSETQFANVDCKVLDNVILNINKLNVKFKNEGSGFGDMYAISCFPNPVKETTNIAYTLPENGQVQITIMSLVGDQITRLVDGLQESGNYNLTFDPSEFGLTTGVYLCRMQVQGENSNFSEVVRIVYMK